MWTPDHRRTANRNGLRYPSDLTDDEWVIIAPMIPPARHGGRNRSVDVREVLNGIFYVLWTGCQWKALPREFGSASAVHAHFQRWQREGFFLKIWKAGLAEYDDMEGIVWRWQSVDGAAGKAPLALECVGSNSTDRGKKWAQTQPPGGRAWHPAVARRQRGQPA